MIETWPGWQNAGLLGEGSFGKVYKIERQEFGVKNEAALKVISIPQNPSDLKAAQSEGMDMAEATAYFRSCVEDIVKEIALMNRLKGDSNIVSYEDHMVLEREDGIGWDILIRMELLTPLLDYIQEHPLTPDDVRKLGLDMARAMKRCESVHIMHRDIKPENIFVSENGNFKLGDFGVARMAEKTVSAMSRKGTYVYMAPEVYKGEVYDTRADLYSVGIVLYRFLNDNRTPFLPPYPQPIRYTDREEALNRRISGEAIPEPTYGSPQLKALVLKACAFDPKDRFANAGELEKAILDTASGSGAPAEKAGSVVISMDLDRETDKTVSIFSAPPQVPVEKSVQPNRSEAVEIKPRQIVKPDKQALEDDRTVSLFDAPPPAEKKPLQETVKTQASSVFRWEMLVIPVVILVCGFALLCVIGDMYLEDLLWEIGNSFQIAGFERRFSQKLFYFMHAVEYLSPILLAIESVLLLVRNKDWFNLPRAIICGVAAVAALGIFELLAEMTRDDVSGWLTVLLMPVLPVIVPIVIVLLWKRTAEN